MGVKLRSILSKHSVQTFHSDKDIYNKYNYVIVIVRTPVLCAITVRGGVVEITIQHEAQPSGVLFIETHLRVPLSRAQHWRPYYELFLVCVGASKTPTVGPVSQTG